MRASTAPRVGTISAGSGVDNRAACRAIAARQLVRASTGLGALGIMVVILVGLSIDLHLRLGLELHHLEPQRIPAAGLGILRGLRIGILNRRHPTAEDLLRSRPL